MNHHKINPATWEDSSTHCVRSERHIGGSSNQPNGLYSLRCQPLAGAGWRWVNAATFVPYIGFYHSPAQVVFATWRAAGCRPYLPVWGGTVQLHGVYLGYGMYRGFLHRLFMGCGIFLWTRWPFWKVLKIYGSFCPFIHCLSLRNSGFFPVRS